MPPKAPPILSHAGAVGVDYRSAIVLRKERIENATTTSPQVVTHCATHAGVSEWAYGGPQPADVSTYPSSPPVTPTAIPRTVGRLVHGSAHQDDLAQSSVEGQLAWCSFIGVNFGLSDLFTIASLNFELPLMGRWQIVDPVGRPTPLASPGEIGVRCIVAIDEAEIFEGLFRLDPVGSQVPSPAQHIVVPPQQIHLLATRWGAHGSAAVPLTEALRTALGHPLTLGAFRGLGARLRVLLSTWVGQEAFSPQWFAGPLRVVINYRDPPDPTQSAAQFRVASALPMASNLVYDSGKMVGVTGNLWAVPPNLAPAGAAIVYADAQVWDGSDVASGFSLAPAQFSTLTATQAAIVHDPVPAALAVDWYVGLVIPAARFRRNSEVAGGAFPNVWQCRLLRSEQPLTAFSLEGCEEDAIQGGTYPNWLSSDPLPATVFVPYDEMHPTLDGLGVLNQDPGGLGAFIWDENADIATSAGVSTLYVRPSDGRWAAGWRGSAAVLRLRLTLSTRQMTWEGRTWDGRMLGWPTITRKVDDLMSSLVSAPAGDLVLSDHDGAMRRLVAHGQFPADGWLTDGRPITIRLMQAGSAYADCPVLTNGVTRWPDGEVLANGAATFRILPLELSPHRAEVGTQTYAKAIYPNVRTSDENKPMPEVLGVDSGGWFPAAVVDRGPNLGGGTTTFRGAAQAGSGLGLVDFRLGDLPVNQTYYYYSGSHIYGLALGQAFFDANIDGEWNVRQQGAGAGASVFDTAGKVARLLISRHGIPLADIDAPSFEVHSAPVHVLVTGPTKILSLLSRMYRSGRFRAVQRIGGRWVAVPEYPEHLDHGIVIRNYQVIGRPGWKLRKELMGATLDVSYPATFVTPVEQRRAWTARSYRTSTQYGLTNAVAVELDTTLVSVFERYAELLETPGKEVEISAGREALYAYPGTTVALLLDRALAPGGSIAWGLFSVEEYRLAGPSRVELTLRYARTLTAAEQV